MKKKNLMLLVLLAMPITFLSGCGGDDNTDNTKDPETVTPSVPDTPSTPTTPEKPTTPDEPEKPAEVVKKDFEGIEFNDLTVAYDGSAKTITATNVPTGAKVTYTNAGPHTEVGEYEITLKVTKDGYNDFTKKAKLTITVGTFDEANLKFEDKTILFDRKDHIDEIKLVGELPKGSTTTLKVTKNGTEVSEAILTGEYKYELEINIPNYNKIKLSATLTIYEDKESIDILNSTFKSAIEAEINPRNSFTATNLITERMFFSGDQVDEYFSTLTEVYDKDKEDLFIENSLSMVKDYVYKHNNKTAICHNREGKTTYKYAPLSYNKSLLKHFFLSPYRDLSLVYDPSFENAYYSTVESFIYSILLENKADGVDPSSTYNFTLQDGTYTLNISTSKTKSSVIYKIDTTMIFDEFGFKEIKSKNTEIIEETGEITREVESNYSKKLNEINPALVEARNLKDSFNEEDALYNEIKSNITLYHGRNSVGLIKLDTNNKIIKTEILNDLINNYNATIYYDKLKTYPVDLDTYECLEPNETLILDVNMPENETVVLEETSLNYNLSHKLIKIDQNNLHYVVKNKINVGTDEYIATSTVLYLYNDNLSKKGDTYDLEPGKFYLAKNDYTINDFSFISESDLSLDLMKQKFTDSLSRYTDTSTFKQKNVRIKTSHNDISNNLINKDDKTFNIGLAKNNNDKFLTERTLHNGDYASDSYAIKSENSNAVNIYQKNLKPTKDYRIFTTEYNDGLYLSRINTELKNLTNSNFNLNLLYKDFDYFIKPVLDYLGFEKQAHEDNYTETVTLERDSKLHFVGTYNGYKADDQTGLVMDGIIDINFNYYGEMNIKITTKDHTAEHIEDIVEIALNLSNENFDSSKYEHNVDTIKSNYTETPIEIQYTYKYVDIDTGNEIKDPKNFIYKDNFIVPDELKNLSEGQTIKYYLDKYCINEIDIDTYVLASLNQEIYYKILVE